MVRAEHTTSENTENDNLVLCHRYCIQSWPRNHYEKVWAMIVKAGDQRGQDIKLSSAHDRTSWFMDVQMVWLPEQDL